MTLGRAGQQFELDPDNARRLVEEAHGETKAALVDLRNLARGIHPAVLTDRGLDAALSALAERSPVPVDVSVLVAPRPAATVEAVAYFVVSEALTNMAKHAGPRAGGSAPCGSRTPSSSRSSTTGSAAHTSNPGPGCPACATGPAPSTAR